MQSHLKFSEEDIPIIRPTPIKFIYCIYNNSHREAYNSKIAKETRITLSYTVRLVKFFNEKGILAKKKNGRENILVLTPKGKKLYNELHKILPLIDFRKEVNNGF